MDFNIEEALARAWKDQGRDDTEYHLHPPGEEGASDLGHCTFQRAWQASGREMPKKKGEKGSFGAMDVGKMHHEETQRKLVPLIKEYYPGFAVGPILAPNGDVEEVYVSAELIHGVTIYSPVDLCVATKPGFVKVKHKFRNIEADVWEKHPDAKWVAIWDIKSANSGSFYRKMEEELDAGYAAQGLAYLAATDLQTLPFLFVNKDDLKTFTKTLHWDADAWEALKRKRLREKEVAKLLKDSADTPTCHKSDFAWHNPGEGWACTYCALSKTSEATKKDGTAYARPKINLDAPCPAALAAISDPPKVIKRKFEAPPPQVTAEDIKDV